MILTNILWWIISKNNKWNVFVSGKSKTPIDGKIKL